MQHVSGKEIEVSKSTGFDKAAKYSFWLSIPIPFSICLAFVAAFYLFPQSVETDPVQASRDNETIFTFFAICIFACDIVAFASGVFSLFGKRTQPASFPLALVGTFAGGIIGFIFLWIVTWRVFGLK